MRNNLGGRSNVGRPGQAPVIPGAIRQGASGDSVWTYDANGDLYPTAEPTGSFVLELGNMFTVAASGDVSIHGIGSVYLFSTSGIVIIDAATELTLTVGSNLVFDGIPTSNPGGTNRVWNDGGTLKIT